MAYKWSEEDLAKSLVGHLQSAGLTIYQEVTGPQGRRADIVAVDGKVRHVIETKTSFNFDVLQQAEHWLRFSHRVSICIPRSREWNKVQFSHRMARMLGIGIITINGRPGALHITEEEKPVFRRKVAHMDLLDEQKSGAYAGAGSARGGHYTPFRATTERLVAAVRQQPGAPTRDYLVRIQHHYASIESARGSLNHWIARGKIPGIFIQDGKLFPTEDTK